MMPCAREGHQENCFNLILTCFSSPSLGAHCLCRINARSGILSDHSGVQVLKRQIDLTWAFTFYILHFVLVRVLLHFHSSLFSENAFIFGLVVSCFLALDCLSSGWALHCLVSFVGFVLWFRTAASEVESEEHHHRT